jgi:hypothetical protein
MEILAGFSEVLTSFWRLRGAIIVAAPQVGTFLAKVWRNPGTFCPELAKIFQTPGKVFAVAHRIPGKFSGVLQKPDCVWDFPCELLS